jgi:orotate phosphoribosyltransferase
VREVAQGTAEGTTATQSGSTHCGTYEENVSYVSNTEKALRIATFYRCLELRANTMAQLTVQYQRLNREGGNYVESNYGPHGVLNYLLQREPNPLMTAFDLWRQVEIETVARGNAFVYVERGDDGWPRAFWLAWLCGYDPATDRFTLAYNGRGGMRTVEANARDVLHFPNTFRMQGGYLGISTLQYARDMLSLSATLDKSALESAAKGGRMKLIIGEDKPASGPGTLSFGMFNKGDMEAYAQEIQSRLYGNDVVALRGLDKVQNISMSAADMQLFDQRQFGVAEICRMMAVPRTLAMDGSNSSYKTNIVDTILCLDGTEVIGACLADELTKNNWLNINAHQTIYVVTPEMTSGSQLLFRDNIVPMIKGKHVLILAVSVATGGTVKAAMEAVNYYGGEVVGIASIFATKKECGGHIVESVFNPNDLEGYFTVPAHECPLCKEKVKIDALINSYGFSKL